MNYRFDLIDFKFGEDNIDHVRIDSSKNAECSLSSLSVVEINYSTVQYMVQSELNDIDTYGIEVPP